MARRVLNGRILKKKDLTLTVLVTRTVKHPLYKKIIKVKKKYAVHNPNNLFDENDIIDFIESRPISKTKKWIVIDQVGE